MGAMACHVQRNRPIVRPTVAEQVSFLWRYRRTVVTPRSGTAAVLEASMSAFSDALRAAQGLPPRPAPRDPELCPTCPHSRARHSQGSRRHPWAGCLDCLCLSAPNRVD